ncbi:MAG: hypothetical protein M3Q85_04140 [Acidobacteriota bacterium]|nr:hypothetical protein [Acidobacteriota bacterium]
MIHSLLHSLAAALLLATVMTVGDFIWAAFDVPHRTLYGIVHGAVMCFFIGAVIGARAGRILAGALAGPLIGVLAAVVFYVLARGMGLGAMLPAWMAFWSLFSLLQQRLPPVERREPMGRASLRGFAAAVLSGLAFYAISGIWTQHEPGGPDYAVHFASWCVAFLPGFLALFAPSPPLRPHARRTL